MIIANNVIDLIGNTPLVKINRMNDSSFNIYAKLEYLNPGLSVKDRLAMSLIKNAEENSLINKDTVIIEPTSGNTGIGLAMICAVKGYKLILTMPESASVERRRLMQAYGAELILTPAGEGMKGAINRALELAEIVGESFIPQQFENPANPKIHYETTAQEIWSATEGEIDILVAGVGTGGTITGTAKFLKEKKTEIQIVAVEPAASPVLSGGTASSHKIQGIGAGFVPDTLDISFLDQVIPVSDEDAFATARELMKSEGIMAGPSAGAAAWAALKVARESTEKNATLVFVAPDNGERYISTPLFQ